MLAELGLDETGRAEMLQLITLLEDLSGQKMSKAIVHRWQTLADEFQEFAAVRQVSPLTLVRQAVEEALDAGSAKQGFCAPKMARVILTRWAKESQKSGGDKERTAKREIPPAVRVYREVHHRYPAKGAWAKIAQTVGTEESDLAFWREILSAWASRGYNPLNVAGPLEWFERREVPKNGSRSDPSNEAVQHRPIETLETIQERLRLNAQAHVKEPGIPNNVEGERQ